MSNDKDWRKRPPEKSNVLALDDARPLQGKPIKMDKLAIAQLRARESLITWIPVSMVAKDWTVSSRRVRALLEGGRLDGRKQENGYWEVKFPYSMTAGTRGPATRREVKKVERMQERLK